MSRKNYNNLMAEHREWKERRRERIFMQIAGIAILLALIFGFSAVMILLGVWLCRGGII